MKDMNGIEIKAGSLVKSKGSSIVRVVIANQDGSIEQLDGKSIRALRKGSHSQDWVFLRAHNVKVVGA